MTDILENELDPLFTSQKLSVRKGARVMDQRREKRGGFYWSEGVAYPSVTQIIDGVLSKPALQYWHSQQVYRAVVANPSLSEKEAMQAPYTISDKAKARGSAVHSIVEVYKHGTDFVTFMEGMTEVLTHEFGHLWQQEGGGKDPYVIGKSKGNGHNLEFRGKMGGIGIHCNDKGQHTQAADGDFEIFMNGYGYERPDVPEAPDGMILDWWKLIVPPKKGQSTLTRWTCPECGLNLRVGKRTDIRVICGDCRDTTGLDVWFVRG